MEIKGTQIKENFILKRISGTAALIIGLVAAVLTIYAFFFVRKKANLQYEIIANSNVLDIKAELSKLDILYDGVSLKQKNENLRIINLKVTNTGNENILNNYYDEKTPVGLKVENGKIIEKPEIIDVSNPYISQSLEIFLKEPNEITFSPIILEHNEYFALKILILHKLGKEPSLSAIGKIAGQKEIKILSFLDKKEERSFFDEIFHGNIRIQLLRLIIYWLIVFVIIAFVLTFKEVISKSYKKNKHKKLVEEFKNKEDYSYKRLDDVIFDRFIKEDASIISQINGMIQSESTLNKIYMDYLKAEKPQDKLSEKNYSLIEKRFFDILQKDGIVTKQRNWLSINQPMKKTLEMFVKFLKEKGEL